MNAHLNAEFANILNNFAMQTPYLVDDREIPVDIEPDLCRWCSKEDCTRCEWLYDLSENGKHD